MKLIEGIRRENLAALRDEYGTVAALAKALDREDSQISQWLNASTNYGTGKPRAMRSSSARWIEGALGKPHGWLDQDHITGTSATTLNDATSTGTGLLDLTAHPDLVSVRRVKFKLQAGVQGYAIEVDNGDGPPIFFRQDWLISRGLKAEKLVAIKVAGQSMEPGLFDGDLVVINTADATPADGEPFAVNYEGEMGIKRLKRDAGEWWLASDNQDKRRYPDKRCNGDVQLIGRVIYKQSERV